MMIRDLLEDLRHALRGLHRRPGFAALVVLSLGLGMGANAAIFSLMNSVFLRPLPVRDPGGLVLFSDRFQAGTNGGTLEPGPQGLYSWPLFRTLRARNAPFEPLAATVTADYFQTLGMTVRQGRGLTADDRRDAPPVAVINESLARRSFGRAPLGRRFRFGHGPSLEVVGVVSDVRNGGLGNPPLATVYLPVAQRPNFLAALEIRVAGDPAPLAEAVRRAVRAADPRVPVVSIRTMTAQIEVSLTGSRVLATLAAAFGVAALLLVCVGLYGVMSRWTAQRTPEIGVRMALGADAAAVRRLVLRQALLLVLAGLLIGVPAALAVARLLGAFLYGVSPLDPRTVVLATGTLLAVAALSAYLPARRASRVDPVIALRAE